MKNQDLPTARSRLFCNTMEPVSGCQTCAESTLLVMRVCTNGGPNVVRWMRRL